MLGLLETGFSNPLTRYSYSHSRPNLTAVIPLSDPLVMGSALLNVDCEVACQSCHLLNVIRVDVFWSAVVGGHCVQLRGAFQRPRQLKSSPTLFVLLLCIVLCACMCVRAHRY